MNYTYGPSSYQFNSEFPLTHDVSPPIKTPLYTGLGSNEIINANTRYQKFNTNNQILPFWSPKVTGSPYKGSSGNGITGQNASKYEHGVQQLAVINDLRAFRQQVRDRISNNRSSNSKSRNLSLISAK